MKRKPDDVVARRSLDETRRIVLTELRLRLEDSAIPYRADVVDLRRVTKEFRERVLREGLRWSS